MPLALADGRIRLTALTTAPTDPAAITTTELTAGIELQDRILKSDYRLSPTASDTVPDTPLSNEGNATTFGASNYEGSVTPFRYLDDLGAADATNDVAWDTLKAKGTRLWLVEREGPKADTAWAADDEYDCYEIVTDNPQKPSDRGGYIKRVVPLGVQDAWLGKAVVAGA